MIKRFGRKDGDKFLAYIQSNGINRATWEYADKCFLNWCNGLINKQVEDDVYVYISSRGWVKI